MRASPKACSPVPEAPGRDTPTGQAPRELDAGPPDPLARTNRPTIPCGLRFSLPISPAATAMMEL